MNQFTLEKYSYVPYVCSGAFVHVSTIIFVKMNVYSNLNDPNPLYVSNTPYISILNEKTTESNQFNDHPILYNNFQTAKILSPIQITLSPILSSNSHTPNESLLLTR